MNDKILHTLSNLPNKPGVYKMKDSFGEIIYIGKAKNLKNRVSSYFSKTKKNIKTTMLVSNIDSIEYLLTASEQDAFSLEANLIKEHKPKYNILLKDDKLFPYIRIDKNQLFPEISVVRKVKKDNALYFGPYVTGIRVSELVSIIKSVFKIRQCKKNFEKCKPLKRKCLFGDLGKCSAPCVGAVTNEEYLKIIDDVIDFLNGKNGKVKKLLTEKMNECSAKMDFEQAIDYRNKLDIIKRTEVNLITNLPKNLDLDCFTVFERNDLIVMNKTIIRNGKTIADSNIYLDVISPVELSDALKEYLIQYYDENVIPKEIISNIQIPNLSEYLKQTYLKTVDLVVPVKGDKKRIVEISEANAVEFLSKNYELCKRKATMSKNALIELAEILQLKKVPYRLECFDISHISGTNTVSSMVVFEDGNPAKKEYRKFKIKTVKGINDFESMEETLTRRLNRLKEEDEKFVKIPDLIVIDGGLGQLHYAKKALDKMGYDIPMISLAEREEEIFTLFSNESIKLPPDNNARKLLQRIRDEAHRFAITYHRTLRNKTMLE